MKVKPANTQWTDEQWEAIAIRGCNVLVSAGAGSGKTAVLSERVLELVREGVDVTDLIVLTFTNAAAAEMKSRIRKKLLEDGVHNPLVMESANKIDSSFITTFDSYCLYLVKKYNHLLNVSSNISIIDNVTANKMKLEILTEQLNQYIVNEEQSVINYIESYSANSINEIIGNLLMWYSGSKQNMNPNFDIDSNQIFERYEQQIISMLNEVKTLVAEINKYAADTNMPDKVNERLGIILGSSTYEQLHLNIEQVFETRFWTVPRTNFNDKEYVKTVNDKLKSILKQIRENVRVSKQEHLAILETNKQTKAVIAMILNNFDSAYFEYKRDLGLYEFIDINLMAIELLKSNPAICQQLKTTVYEIMIDEYQDTNDIQERFISLISNNNVYMVGDIKQSIYGFRNANPKLFANKFEAYRKAEGGHLVTLTKNFRSRAAVLEQVNNFFDKTMSKPYGGIEYDQSQIMLYGNKSYDLLADSNTNEIITYDSEQLEISKEDFEIMQIFKDIKNKLETGYQVVDGGDVRSVRLSDFAIICATRSSFSRIVTIGEYFNLSVNADIQEQFKTSNEVSVLQSIFNIINAVKNDQDDDQKLIFSILQLARSYLFDYSDEQIDSGIEQLNRIDKTSVSKRLYGLSMSSLGQIAILINEITSNLDLKSNYQIFTEIIDKFDVLGKLHRLSNPLSRQMRIAKLGELIVDFDNRTYDLNTVCQMLNEIEKNPDLDIEFSTNSEQETDSITVITTHKSKGLEYNICYFPFLYKRFNVMDLNSKYGYSHDFNYILPGQLSSGNLTNTIEKVMWSTASRDEVVSEKIRLFYVAITRAKDKNILIVDTSVLENQKFKGISSANSINDILFNGWEPLKRYVTDCYQLTEEQINASLFNKFAASSKEKQGQLIAPAYLQPEFDAKVFERKRASGHITEIIDKQVATNIEKGNEVHEYLEFVDLFAIDAAIENSSDLQKRVLENIKNSELLTGMVNYYPEFQFKITSDYEMNGIIDLLVETEDKFIVIDYKLNAIDKPEYIEQVTTYVEYIKSISTKKVEGYLLSLLSGAVIKVI